MSTIYNEVMTDIKSLGYDFRINDLDEQIEVFFEGSWHRLNDTIEAIIELKMRELGYGKRNVKEANLSAMRQSWIMRGHKQRYNPIKDYLDSQADRYDPKKEDDKWIPYAINALGHYFKNPDGMFRSWLFKWMVGAVAKVYQGERNPMLVLAGTQHIGKSYFCQWLCPIDDRFIRGGIKPDNKDHTLRLANGFLWEVDELGGTTRRQDVEALKSFITLNTIYERQPFAKHPIHKQTNVSFIGTANIDGAGFLNDPTGTTRFLVCEINGIIHDYSRNLNPNNLWAEAVWFYRNVPGSWELSKEEQRARDRINAQFENYSALDDVIHALFMVNPESDSFLTTQDIRFHVQEHYRISNEQAFFNELGRVLTKAGLSRARQGHSRGWAGIGLLSKEAQNDV